MNTIQLEHPRAAIDAAFRELRDRREAEALGVPYIGGGTVGAWVVYPEAIKAIGNKEVDLDSDTFKFILLTSSYSYSQSHSALSSLSSNEASNYTRPTATGLSWTRSGGTLTWDVGDPQFDASGGSCVFRYIAIYDDTHANDIPIAYALIDTTPANVTIATGDSLIVQIHASGVLTAA